MGRRTLQFLTALILSLAVVTPVVAAPTFTDVPESNIFYDDIEWLSVMEITQGCNPPVNDLYCPNDYVTRGQMAAFLVRALGLTNNGGGDHFTDDDGSVFESSIDKLYTAGITQGCNPPTNDHYCPNSYVTRGQMAAFLVRAICLTDDGGGDHFTDDDGSVFESSIDKLYTAGITMGCNPPTNDHYCPNDNVTRGQMAAFLRRGLDHAPPKVTGVVATTNGPDEIAVFWDASSHLDVDHYNVWRSYAPGSPKTPIVNPWVGPEPTTGDRWWVVVDGLWDPGYECFQVSAVDIAGQEGPRSSEACFDFVPGAPSQVTGVTVGTGGGSGEAYISWTPNPEWDVDHYDVWYSEFPGGFYNYESEIDGNVRDGSNRVYYLDWPVDQTVGKTCYKIAAVDQSGNEGALSGETCFSAP